MFSVTHWPARAYGYFEMGPLMSLFAFHPVVTVDPLPYSGFHCSSLLPKVSFTFPHDRSTMTDLWHLGGSLIFSSSFMLDGSILFLPKLVAPAGVLCRYRLEHGIILTCG